MTACVLVITSSFDEHADILCPKFEKNGAGVFRFNTDNLEKYEIRLASEEPCLQIKDLESGEVVTSEDVSSVWYRRPSPDKSFDEKLDEDSIKLFRSETKEWVKSISLSLSKAFWVTHPSLLYEARIKSNQLMHARKVGLDVPKTIITRSKQPVESLLEECPDGVIAKSLRAPYVESKDSYYTLRTQEIKQRDLDDESLFVCPTVFQERIRAQYELRIVVVGERLFTFKATTKNKDVVDIRASGPNNIEYAYCSISSGLEVKIRNLVKGFHLPFSSMDLLVDQNGREFFVDLNPNGQWLWLEYSTGVNLSDSFIQMMTLGKC